MGAAEIEAFLTHLAVKRDVSASTQNQALAALLFLYKEVLKLDLPWLQDIVRAKKPQHLPVVLTRAEVEALLAQLQGVSWIVANLLYGSGLRLLEALRLRVKDVDFARREILVRDGKGQKDRVTMLPMRIVEPLQLHLDKVRGLHCSDLAEGFGEANLPFALARKYPNAAKEWGWQFVFPSINRSRDRAARGPSVITCTRRPFSVRCARRRGVPARSSMPRRIRCAIHSPLTCWRRARTSARCRSCSATPT